MMIRLRVLIALLGFALLSTPAFAQVRRQRVPDGAVTVPDRPITAAERRQLGEILPHLLETLYVVPETGRELAARMRAAFEQGRYDSATTASTLAETLNRDLAAANDRHLSMRFDSAAPAAPVLTVDAWKARRASMRAGHVERARDRDATRLVNFGVRGAEVLDGNIGYLEIREFMNTEETRAALSHAMGLLAQTDAMIVDVRNCPGGSADTVSYLASYFFGPGQRVLMNRYNRPMDRTMESTTVDVPGRRMPETPLYVLTGRTASACESFVFTLQQWGRASTVGERTAGAGYNNMLVDVGLGLTLSVSIGTAVHPRTGKGFEATGVQPDVPAPAERALEVARARALRVLGDKATTEAQKRAVQSALRSATTAPSTGVPAEPEKLKDYVGRYGPREITLRDGTLHYQRVGGHGGALKPIEPDVFDLNGDVRITFDRGSDGAVHEMRIQWKDGRTETVARETKSP